MIQISNWSEIPDEGCAVLDLWAKWCSPCLKMTPVLDKLMSEFSPNVNFYGVDIDVNSDLAKQFKVKSIPCIIFLRNKQEIHRTVGITSYESLQTVLQNLIKG